MADSTFSIDINTQYTRLCDAAVNKGKIELLSLGYDLTAPFFFSSENEKVIETEAAVISNLYSKLKIKKKSVTAIISDEFTFSQILEMPKLKEKELLAAIRYQADEFIPMPIDETNIDLEILKEDPVARKLLLLIVAIPKKTVNQIQKTIEFSGLTAESLENELSAIGRLFSEVLKPTGGATIVVNIGYSTSSIYLIESSTSFILLARTFKIGIDLFIKDVKVNLNLDEPKIIELLKTIGLEANPTYNLEPLLTPILNELNREVEKFVLLAKDRFNLNVDKIFLFNMNSMILNLDKRIESFFNIPTKSMLLQEQIIPNQVSQSFNNEISSFISAIAGAIR